MVFWHSSEWVDFSNIIQSTGEIEGNKISILTKGKNLAPVNSGEFSVDKSNTSNWYFINGSGGAYGDMSNNKTKFYLPSGNYTFKGNCNGFVQLTEQNEREIINNGTSKELKAGYYIIRFRNSNGVEKINFDKIQITLANYDAEYESYKEDKTEILLPSPHMRLTSGNADVIDFDKNERTKNVVKAVLNGSENGWVKFDTDGIQGFKLVNSNISQDNFMCLSDNITALEQRIWYKSNETSIAISYGAIYLKFKGITEINDMKAKLKANPTTVYYQLAEPKTEKLNIKDTLQSFENGYIMLDNAITPTAHLEYSTNIPSALGGLTKVVDNNVDEITNIESTVSDINIELGDEPLKTTSETIRGAINENTLELKDCAKNIENVQDLSMNYKTNKNYKGYDDTKIYTWTKMGTYITNQSGVLDLPDGWNQGRYEVVTFNEPNNVYNSQIIFGDPYNKKMAFRYCVNENSKWIQLATVDDTGWLDLPLADGISSESGWTCQYRKVNNLVQLRGIIKGITTETQSDKAIATLPVGFRPFATNITLLPRSTNDDNYLKIYVSSGGVVGTKGSNMSSIVLTNGFMLTPIMFLVD